MNALNTGWDLFLPKPYKDGGSADNGAHAATAGRGQRLASEFFTRGMAA